MIHLARIYGSYNGKLAYVVQYASHPTCKEKTTKQQQNNNKTTTKSQQNHNKTQHLKNHNFFFYLKKQNIYINYDFIIIFKYLY